MAYVVLPSSLILVLLLLLLSIQTGVQSELSPTQPIQSLSDAIRILSDSGYANMSSTLELASHASTPLALAFNESDITIFAPPDTAFSHSEQPSLNLLQYHIAPGKYSLETLQSLLYGTRIRTLLPDQSLFVSSFRKVSLNGVRINQPAVLDNYGALTIYGVERFFDPSYQITYGCKDYWLYSDTEFDNEIANASAVLLSRGYSIMSSALGLQLRGLVKETTHLTIFAVADSVLAPYSSNLSLASVFHRHLLHCKLTEKDLWGLEDGTTLQTLDHEDFTIRVSKSGEQLLLNDVPVAVFVPEMYLSDSIVVHGIGQIITEPSQIVAPEP